MKLAKAKEYIHTASIGDEAKIRELGAEVKTILWKMRQQGEIDGFRMLLIDSTEKAVQKFVFSDYSSISQGAFPFFYLMIQGYEEAIFSDKWLQNMGFQEIFLRLDHLPKKEDEPRTTQMTPLFQDILPLLDQPDSKSRLSSLINRSKETAFHTLSKILEAPSIHPQSTRIFNTIVHHWVYQEDNADVLEWVEKAALHPAYTDKENLLNLLWHFNYPRLGEVIKQLWQDREQADQWLLKLLLMIATDLEVSYFLIDALPLLNNDTAIYHSALIEYFLNLGIPQYKDRLQKLLEEDIWEEDKTKLSEALKPIP